MRPSVRPLLILILSLVLGLAGGGSATAAELAVEPPAEPAEVETATPPAEPATTAEPLSSQQVRSQLSTLLYQHPPELATILTLDPTLLSSEAFLAGYPELSRFVSEHPEVRRNPRFYLSAFAETRQSGALDHIVETLVIFGTFLLIALALAWLVRTVIEQKRWNRLSRTQSEVHNKILDRFGTTDELLDYMRTPAGTRFLESAPIPLHAERVAQSGSASRIVWSIQIGVVVAAAALGMLLVGLRFEGETAEGLFAMGAIGLCVGAGFVASAVVSTFLSRRLGVWESPADAPAPSVERVDEPGLAG